MLALKILGVNVGAVSSSATALLMNRAPDARDNASFSLKSGNPVAPRRLQNRFTEGSLTPADCAKRAMDDRVVSSGLARIAFATFCSALLKAWVGWAKLVSRFWGVVMAGLKRNGLEVTLKQIKSCNPAT